MAQLFPKVNTLAFQGMKLSYIAPNIREGMQIARLQKQEINKTHKKWKALVVIVVGERPLIAHL